MEVRPTTARTRRQRRGRATGAGARTKGVAAIVALALLTASACTPPDADGGEGATLDVERPLRESGDIEAEVGDQIEVHGITVTVVEVGRVAEYGEFDDWGYVWARIEVENTSPREIEFHRRHFQLEKPDDTVSNTANIASESQIAGGTTMAADRLAPGATREGQVIYTAGDLEGQFALIYRPEPPSGDTIDRERGVWVFQSSPDDAG